MAEPLLELRLVSAGYGDGIVLDHVSVALPEGGSLALLGRNGVGKTTLILTVMGYLKLASGSIFFRGRDISRLAPHRRARLGLGWVPQERDIFPSLSVEENLTVAARRGRWDLQSVYGLFPRLRERRANMGNQLSGGDQQMLTIARTGASRAACGGGARPDPAGRHHRARADRPPGRFARIAWRRRHARSLHRAQPACVAAPFPGDAL